MRHSPVVALALLTLAFPLRSQPAPESAPAAVQAMMSKYSAPAMRAHTRFLASDLLEGRGPGTRGDALAEEYVAAQFEAYGLAPAGDNGTYFQKVPLVGLTSNPERTTMRFLRGERSVDLTYLEEFVASDESQAEKTAVDAETVFAGYGVVAPEYRWNDYKGLDVRGKVVVLLAEDPPATPKEPGLFAGKARTYYGRWTYKFEEATRQGAAGCILIHTVPSAGYGWNVVRNSWGRERPAVRLAEGQPALHLAGWITEPAAAKLFALAGKDLGSLVAAAGNRSFKPVPLGVRASVALQTTVRPFETGNVAAKVEGSDPALRDQYVVYTAHHDHLGIGTPRDGDAIYNGALDNATGVALLLDLARVFAASEPKPRRSVLFVSVAGEEGGLLGSQYYAEHPLVPAGKTALVLNFDSVYQLGRVRNVQMLGLERTTFAPEALRITAAMGLRIDADEHPEQGMFFRSDHFSLARIGIPAISVKAGSDYVDRPAGWGREKFEEYEAHHYHQPSDEFDPTWDFSEGVQLAQLATWLGWDAANAEAMPTWNAGDEYRAIRDASLSGK